MGRMPLMAGLLLLATLVVPQAWAGGATWSELSYPIGIEKHLVRSAPQVEIHSINEAGHINYGTLYRSGHTHGECGQCAAYRVLTNIRHGARGKLDKQTSCPLALTLSKYRENWSLSLTAMLLDCDAMQATPSLHATWTRLAVLSTNTQQPGGRTCRFAHSSLADFLDRCALSHACHEMKSVQSHDDVELA